MSSQGPLLPASGASDTGVGSFAWVGASNITAADGTFATAGGASGASSNYLRGGSFSFSIPSTATINGIVGQISLKALNGFAKDTIVKLAKAGVVGGNSNATNSTVPLTQTLISYGSNTDLWGQTWAPSDINAAGFGFAYSFNCSGGSDQVSVDYMQITVYYTLPSGVVCRRTVEFAFSRTGTRKAAAE